MKRIYCKLTYQQVDGLIKQAVDDLDWKLLSGEAKVRIYKLKVPVNLLSFGNEVSVTVVNTAKRGKSIVTESTSAVSFQVIEWGKNSTLEELFADKIKELYEALRKK